ncbi:unnamed protein product [Phytomonas sp. Hart1]|nr:unnamed protein product [Phytomonas sp. Hart1]|eukprot:CCW69980.1 unnamed protein product [Phytomonas sp. isolate Hart1]
MARLRLLEELLKGALPASCPALRSREGWVHSLLQPALFPWLAGHRRAAAEEAQRSSDNLARLSADVVAQLARRHPVLRKHIFAEKVPVHKVVQGKAESDAPHLIQAQTAHASPLMVDPVGWTRALAGVCSSKYRVRFALSERWESANTYLKYDVEVMRSILTSVANPQDATQARQYREHMFDIVVLAMGSQTGVKTSQSFKFPIIPLSGYAVALSGLTEPLLGAIKGLFHGDKAASLTQLSGPCSLYAYRFPHSDGGSHNNDTSAKASPKSMELSKDSYKSKRGDRDSASGVGEQYYLTGLLSFNTILQDHCPTVVFKALSNLEAYLRVKCNVEVPLIDAQADIAEKVTKHAEADDNSREQCIEVEEYTRGFTPDGVPLVDQCGGTFNMFVCSGFGDHAMDFAPGAAKILSNLIQTQAENLFEKDEAQLKLRGTVDGVFPRSRRAQLEKEMHFLLNGILLDKTDKRWWSLLNPLNWHFGKQPLASEGVCEKQLVHFNVNPFSTDRYARLIRKDFQENSHYSPIAYISVIEEALVRKTEPTIEYLTRWAIDLARKETTPDFIRTIVFNLVYDYELDIVGQNFIPKLEETRLQLMRKNELETARNMEIIDQSRVRSMEIDRRALGPLMRTTDSMPGNH